MIAEHWRKGGVKINYLRRAVSIALAKIPLVKMSALHLLRICRFLFVTARGADIE